MTATAPCSTCPYRRSTPPGIWHPSEYEKLREKDGDMIGAVYNCHLDDGTLCRGWLADQKRRGIPSIALRLKLILGSREGGSAATRAFEAVDEKDPDLYDSIAEMCAANVGKAFPSRTRAAQKVLRVHGTKGR